MNNAVMPAMSVRPFTSPTRARGREAPDDLAAEVVQGLLAQTGVDPSRSKT